MNEVKKFAHPGFKRGQGRATNPGRQVSPEALATVQEILGSASRARDELLENLHRLNDHFGHLDTTHLNALAAEMRIAQSELYEVASFYAHFRILREDETPPTKPTVRICNSLSCMMCGAEDLAETLRQRDDVNVEMVPCVGRCDVAPVAEIGHHHLGKATADTVTAALKARDFRARIAEVPSLDEATKVGHYQFFQACLEGSHARETLIETIKTSGLRGMGGAGFPTGTKWAMVRNHPGPRLMAVNADEGEPGTFKDYLYLKDYLHEFLEGTLIAAWVVEAEVCYIYLRDEYPDLQKNLTEAVAALNQSSLAATCRLVVRRGAGAYICGEESAMIESIEGKRPLPRHRPPYVAEVGLFGRPTLVNNVETLYWVRQILTGQDRGFADQGRNGGKGWRSYSVSGRVREPGVKCAPAGITLSELIEEYCGGMQPGHQLKAYLPGGASGGILPASLANLPLEFGTLQEYGCFIGSAAIVVLSDQDDLAAAALNLMEFFAYESCGQCTPCRVGTEKATMLMREKNWQPDVLQSLCQVMADASICGLGQAAGNPLVSLMRFFPEDVPKSG